MMIGTSAAAVVVVGAMGQQSAVLPSPVANEQLAILQAELGLTGIAATLSDFTLSDLASIRTTLLQSQTAAALLVARAAADETERQIAAIKEAAAADVPATAALQALRGELTARRATVAAQRTQLSGEVRAAVPTAAWAMLDRVNAAPVSLPAAMKVLEGTPAELTALSDAVFEEKKVRGNLSALSQADRDRLTAARTNSAVVAAAARLTARLAEVGRALRGLSN